MKILFIVPYVPNPIRVRPFSLLKTLLAGGNQVTLATLWSNQEERAQLASLEQLGAKIVAEPLPRWRSLQNCLGVGLGQTPWQAVYCWQPRLNHTLHNLLARERFDVIHVEHLRGAHYGLALKDKGIPIVWDSVDSISYLFAQAVAHSRSLFGKWMTRLELGRTRHYEGWLVRQFETVLVTSRIDKQALVELADQTVAERIKVVPNGVDQSYFTPNGSQREPDRLVFSGKMSYHANVTMAMHLVQDIMPRIWAERPQTRLTIVGANPPASVQQLGQDQRVSVTGFVPDMRPYLQRAAVAVVPAAYGAGIQNKVLEAMACATPVVATERAVAALELAAGQDILVAANAEAFAQQVLTLLRDPSLRQTVGVNGHHYVQRKHAWSQIGANLTEIYRHAAR
jgi:sugar transferase (PEP-CTERM/EpsH1 system associated)